MRPSRGDAPAEGDDEGEGSERRRTGEALIRSALGVDCSLEGLDLPRLARASAAELSRRLAIAADQARRLEACFRLGREVERSRLPPRPCVGSPEGALAVIGPELRGRDRECFLALLMDGRHRLLERRCVSVGTLTSSLVHPREVFGPALSLGAAAVVVAHNHPSGDPEPSPEDRAVTRRLQEVGHLVGVPLIDHLVVGDPGYVSMRRRGWMA